MIRITKRFRVYKITHTRKVFGCIAGAVALAACANRGPSGGSLTTPPVLRDAEAVIDAFYSFDSSRLKAAMATAAPSIPRIVFYQGWARGGNYAVVDRMPCKFAAAREISCAITVKDDLIGALGIDFNVTDTFHLAVEKNKIARIRTTSNDPKAFNDAFEWVRKNRQDLIREPCRGFFDGGPTPDECVRAVVRGFAEFAAPGLGMTPAAPDTTGFVERLDSLRKASSIPGLSVAVVKDKSIILALGLGYADFEQRIPATAETPYDIASVTKPLSAVVALKLVEEGKLDLDRPMADYSEWADFCKGFSQQPSVFAKGLRCQPATHTLRHLLTHTAVSRPGDSFSYNPVLYSWASRPIMEIADTSFSTLVDRYVFAPAGMTRSVRRHRALPVRDDVAKLLAPPHRVGASGVIERSPPLSPQGDGAAGGVISTVLDLARFDIALDNGALISPASRRTMMAPARSGNGATLPYALGWYVEEYRGLTLVWHSGWWEKAYSSLYLKIPELDVSFIVLANSEGIWWDNPLDKAEVHRSQFAQAFLRAFAR